MTTQPIINPALALLERTNAVAKARKLAINEILSECRSAASLQALVTRIEHILAACEIREANALIIK